MVTIDRYLRGLVPYKAVFFPTDQALAELTERSKRIQLARLFWTPTDLRNASRVVQHERSATVCIDLSATLETLSKGIAKNTRYEIRQAEKLGDRIRIERNGPEVTDKFLVLFNDFARSKPEVSAINHSALRRYEGHADIFMAYLDENPVCGPRPASWCRNWPRAAFILRQPPLRRSRNRALKRHAESLPPLA